MVEKIIDNNDDGKCDNLLIGEDHQERMKKRTRDLNDKNIMFLLRFILKRPIFKFSHRTLRGLGPPLSRGRSVQPSRQVDQPTQSNLTQPKTYGFMNLCGLCYVEIF